ncbi:MAG: hypothetical protein GF317_10595 [Candidatus Lokiarchaeota archaeon]|nr:hypothetical protein [Candidatus Lokiarchaeota archaeon]MBD3200109.1 hypothetical protein [Candidatus Lokiarchaeota archaeon]
MGEDTSGQWVDFYKKKGDNLVEISENHYKNKEYKKSLELLNQAYNMYKKGNAMEFAEKTKQRFNEIKQKHFKKKE